MTPEEIAEQCRVPAAAIVSGTGRAEDAMVDFMRWYEGGHAEEKNEQGEHLYALHERVMFAHLYERLVGRGYSTT